MCLSSFINIICFFYFFLLWNILKVNVRKIGIYIYLLFTIIYSILFLINPGTPDKSHFLENNINESLVESRICNICKIVIKPPSPSILTPKKKPFLAVYSLKNHFFTPLTPF